MNMQNSHKGRPGAARAAKNMAFCYNLIHSWNSFPLPRAIFAIFTHIWSHLGGDSDSSGVIRVSSQWRRPCQEAMGGALILSLCFSSSSSSWQLWLSLFSFYCPKQIGVKHIEASWSFQWLLSKTSYVLMTKCAQGTFLEWLQCILEKEKTLSKVLVFLPIWSSKYVFGKFQFPVPFPHKMAVEIVFALSGSMCENWDEITKNCFPMPAFQGKITLDLIQTKTTTYHTVLL